MNDATIIDRRAVREVARNRPELFALLLVVAMFLGFLTFAGERLVSALDRNTTALETLSYSIRK